MSDITAQPPNAPASRTLQAQTRLTRGEKRSVFWISLGAIAVFAIVRLLPTGTNLNHSDFQTGSTLELCDPANPQFVPAMEVKSPVSMKLIPAGRISAGETVACGIELTTATGKPVGPLDLLVVHTEKLHLLIVDPSLNDYQHVHPIPGATPGQWRFSFQPRRAGVYRFFADFTPAAVARSLYATAELTVESPGPSTQPIVENAVEAGDPQITFTPQQPFEAGRPVDLVLEVAKRDGSPVGLEPIMGAYAHVVAFDEARSGFAHLHPATAEPPTNSARPQLRFRITLKRPGRYVLWAQLRISGRERFAPFWFDVR